jgi:5-methylcytosine-specific restriction endonuclease McrA
MSTTNTYGTLLKSPNWFRKREVILARDNHKCRNCGATDNLNVHHRQYHVSKKTGNFILPWNYLPKYLITLCEKCHLNGHSKFRIPTFKI